MADAEKTQKPEDGVSIPRTRGPSRAQQLSKLYSLPAPLRTFPLPTLVPHNPISLFQVLYSWVSQTIYPPSSHPETLYQGWFSEDTRSVHVTDPKAIRALWEQGFYGKGNLSRSEPSWLDREKRRKGATANQTSEEVTRNRRAERQQVKWERARKEREAIDQKLLEERGHDLPPASSINGEFSVSDSHWQAPVGPLELLLLPNSSQDLSSRNHDSHCGGLSTQDNLVYNMNGYSKASEDSDMIMKASSQHCAGISHISNDTQKDPEENGNDSKMNGNGHINGTANSDTHFHGPPYSPKQIKGQKSVRFSPTVEKTTFLQSEPPSPELAATSVNKVDEPSSLVQDKEHLQLTMEEAFFLSYGLGVLAVSHPRSKAPISTNDLLSLCRSSSYFTPSKIPSILPDDSFMLSYVVYHHFRSLGWVVRGGTKFSVDYLLYNRGPVFSHAEFAVLVLPSYSDPSWSVDKSIREYVAAKEKRRWSWLHCINRVNSQVKKTIVLVYVEIPPLGAHTQDGLCIDDILKQYKIREFVLKRWVSNRSRD